MISAWISGGRILASYRVDGRLDVRDIGAAEYSGFLRVENEHKFYSSARVGPDFQGWLKVVWPDYESRKADLDRYRDILYEADVSPVKRFLANNNCRIDRPRRAYIDFETDSRIPPREQVEFGRARLLSWALVDEEGLKRTAILAEDTDDSEADLWAQLWTLMAEYDQISAWNGQDFDFPVIEHRCRELSRYRRELFAPYFEHRRRLLFIDQLLVFERHHMAPESGDDKTSLKLNDVCQSILGKGKHDFAARRTWEAWSGTPEERAELVKYNLIDTELLLELEKATGYLDLQQTLAEVTFSFANTYGITPTSMFDGYMLRKAFLEKTHLPTKHQPSGNEKKYEGAYVMPPSKLGIHERVHVCDFKSLYPTVIRSLNISPETKGRPGCTAFGTNVTFSVDREGMLPAAMRELMQLRDYWKHKAAQNPDDKDAERKSKAYKIACNAGYGLLGNVWSRYYDPELAESVTLGAKHLTLETIKAAEERGWECIYSDTDSLFIIGPTVDEFKEFVKWCNVDLYPKLLAERGVPQEMQCIELDYEKCLKCLVFPLGNDGAPTSKRYFASFEHYKFKEKTGFEIKGIEYMRGDSIRLARKVQHEVISKILGGERDGDTLEKFVADLRESFMLDVIDKDDIKLTKGLGRELDQYSPRAQNNAPVRMGRELEARGEDVGAGTRIEYVLVDGDVSPMAVTLADDFDGVSFDRRAYWNKMIYPPIMKVLASAIPDRNWTRWLVKKVKKTKRPLAGQLSLLGN